MSNPMPFYVSLHMSLRMSLCISLRISLRMSLRMSLCPSVCPPTYVPPYVLMSLRMSPYVCSSVCLTSRYVCSFLVSFLYISPCLSVSLSVGVSLCAPPCAPRISVRAGAAGVVFLPNLSISLMQLGSGGKRTVGAAAVGGLFDLIYLPVLSIAQSIFLPHSSTCFIGRAEQFGSRAYACGSCSRRCVFPNSFLHLFYRFRRSIWFGGKDI